MGMSCFFRWNVDAHHKSLVFFRSFLPPAVANPMFCVYCPQLSLIPCFVCICLHILQIFVWFCVVRCSLWHAVPESSWSFNAILRCFLRAVYGNVVFSRSKMDAHHKSLVFFRSLLLTAVANLMFCMYCLHILQIFV